MNIEEIKERLIRLDEDVDLLFPEDMEFKCYIVGGGALMIMGYITRATHDIDILETVPNVLGKLFVKYDMNNHVTAYADNFPMGYEERAVEVDVETKRVAYYTLSLEDLVISKLCTTRSAKERRDLIDIEGEQVVKKLDWAVLGELADSMKYSMFSSVNYENFRANYEEYVRRFGNEAINF